MMKPMMIMSLPPVPENFALKKQKILTTLATPSSSYTDLSPKGSLDTGIKDLIDMINRLDGIVTTSSCAGRISVFLEGSKTAVQIQDEDARYVEESDDRGSASATFGPVGGKGRGGRWLFVSHDPIEVPPPTTAEPRPLSTILGFASSASPSLGLRKSSQLRLVRFQFEPMILHILTASLHHARSILAAAISAGFRESGVSSLKSLDDPAKFFPTLAVRSSGLALESLIGYLRDADDDDSAETIQSLVEEEHLELLVRVANERFAANADRIRRFSNHLFSSSGRGGGEGAEGWEDTSARKERKRAEGLRRQQEQKALQR